MEKLVPRRSANFKLKSLPAGKRDAVARMMSPTSSAAKPACGVCNKSMSRKYVILTQRWPPARWAMKNGLRIEQNQVKTMKSASATSALAASGKAVIWLVVSINCRTVAPRALTPERFPASPHNLMLLVMCWVNSSGVPGATSVPRVVSWARNSGSAKAARANPPHHYHGGNAGEPGDRIKVFGRVKTWSFVNRVVICQGATSIHKAV